MTLACTGSGGEAVRRPGRVTHVRRDDRHVKALNRRELADRFGFKRMFLASAVVMAPAYILLAAPRTFWGFLIVYFLVAVGHGMFKPVVISTVAKSTNEENGSVGFGIFYMMVNIGGFLGPIVAGIVRGWDWRYVFYASAGWILIMGVTCLVFYREPARDEAAEAEMLETLAELDCHAGSPDKTAARRIATLEAAGELAIPFTTGILVGIGETRDDRIEALHEIARIHDQFGHILSSKLIATSHEDLQNSLLGCKCFHSPLHHHASIIHSSKSFSKQFSKI